MRLKFECKDPEKAKKLVEENVQLVGYVFGIIKPQMYGFTEEDFLAYGMMGLWEAAQRYDPKFGTKFSTLAVRCIRTAMLYQVDKRRRHYQYAQMVAHVMSDPIPGPIQSNSEGDVTFEDALSTGRDFVEDIATHEMLRDVFSRMDDNARYLVKKVYIDGCIKEKLGAELGVTGQQVNNWLKNIAKAAKVPGKPITIGLTKRKLTA